MNSQKTVEINIKKQRENLLIPCKSHNFSKKKDKYFLNTLVAIMNQATRVNL